MSLEHLAQKDVFQLLTPEQISFISDYAQTVSYKAGDPVYFRNTRANFIFVVLSGEISLHLPSTTGEGMLIDALPKGALFGRCVSLSRDTYVLNARCSKDAKVLKIAADVLKKVLDDSPRMGYAVQSKIAEIYYDRYIETMKKFHEFLTIGSAPLQETSPSPPSMKPGPHA